MKFFHVYSEQYFAGLVKNGLINKNTGFKIQHAFCVPEYMKFNNLAAKGGKLHSLLKEGNHPFYVDRIAGGIAWYKYDFDRALIREYDALLGDWFLGFQLHESGSNRRYLDWGGIKRTMGHDGPYDPETLKKALLSEKRTNAMGFPMYSLNMDAPETYAKMRYAKTPEEYIEEMKDMFRRRMAEVDGHILPCDSGFALMKMENELGLKSFMPEVGGQIPQMRQQVALTRGIAENNHKTWGTYYECWFHRMDIGYTMPCYNTDPGNEWYLPQELHGDDFTSYGENGGSSRLLQRRIFYYSLMSGAHYVAEEWGLNCSYTDMKEFTLSEYGEVKKEFINTAEELGSMKAVVPFAIVLPCDYSVLEFDGKYEDYRVGIHRDGYMHIPLDPERKAYYGHIQDVLRYIYAQLDETYGNEGHTLTNSRFGDLFDIIYADAGEEAFQKYTALIDSTPEGDFAKKQAGSGLKILRSADLETLGMQINMLAAQVLPCTVDGLHWLLSVGNDGTRYLTIFNNEGNQRDLKLGNIIDHRADRRVKVTFQESAQLRIVRSFCDGIVLERVDEDTWYVTVPAAEMVVLSY